MTLPRLYVWSVAVVYALVGVCFLFAPASMGALVELDVQAAAARTDVRAVYGGLQIGVAVFLGWCALDVGRTRIGIAASTLTVLGLAVARAAGLLVDGPTTINVGFLATELLCVGMGVLAWRTSGP